MKSHWDYVKKPCEGKLGNSIQAYSDNFNKVQIEAVIFLLFTYFAYFISAAELLF
jgi:hypothetical protein